MKNILVATELDNDTEQLLIKAKELAGSTNAKLWITHIAAPEPDFVGFDAGPQSVRDQRAAELRDEHRRLQAVADELRKEGIDAEGLLIQGATVETIVDESKNIKADLIIIGHHEHGFLYKLFAGSVSEEIVDKSKVPVLLVPVS